MYTYVGTLQHTAAHYSTLQHTLHAYSLHVYLGAQKVFTNSGETMCHLTLDNKTLQGNRGNFWEMVLITQKSEDSPFYSHTHTQTHTRIMSTHRQAEVILCAA